jgi:hypothetical protein
MTEQTVETFDPIDLIEQSYGDGKKATKTVKPKAEEKPIETKVEPKVEAKVENKAEVKTEEKPIVTDTTKQNKAENKEIKETKADFFDPTESPKKEDKKVEPKIEDAKPITKTKEDLLRDQEFETYKKTHETFKKLESTTLGKVLLQAQELGKDPIQVLSELQPKDYKSVDDRVRATDFYSKVEGLDGEDLKQAVDEFLDKDTDSISYKIEKNKQIKALTYQQEEMLRDYSNNINESSKQQYEVIKNYEHDVERLIEQSKSAKQMYGMQLTTEQFAELDKECREYSLIDESGRVKAGDVLALNWFKKYGRQRFRQIAENAKSEGREEVLERVINPDPNTESISNKRTESTKPTGEQLIEDRWGGGTKK